MSHMNHVTVSNFVTSFKDYVQKFIKDYNEGLFAIVVALLTFGLERLLDKETFSCPRTGYYGYGVAFFVCPILMLTLLNWLTMPAEGGHYIWTIFERCWIPAYHRRGDLFSGFLSAVSVGLIAPTAWIFLALLNAQHLVCWELGYQFDDNVTTSYLDDRGFGYLTVQDYNDKIIEAKSRSHTASVIFLGCSVVFFCFVIILRRSCLKPFDPDERLKGLWYFEKLEAFAARDELVRLLDDDNEFDEFTTWASLLQFIVIKESIFSLQNEIKSEKDGEKLREIKTEMSEFEELEEVLHLWAELYKMKLQRKFDMIPEDSEKLVKAKSDYESKQQALMEKREKRQKSAEEILEEYKNPPKGSVSISEEEAFYQSWLLTRLKQQNSYFDIDKLVERWKEHEIIKENDMERLIQGVESQEEKGLTASPKARGRIVASYIVNLSKNQNKFCSNNEQVMEKFRSIYPRAATSDPTLRYVEVKNPMYKYIIDQERNATSGRVPLLYACVKPWEKENENEWETFLLKNHEHSFGWRITGCLKTYCPLHEKNRRRRSVTHRNNASFELDSAPTIITVRPDDKNPLTSSNNSH